MLWETQETQNVLCVGAEGEAGILLTHQAAAVYVPGNLRANLYCVARIEYVVLAAKVKNHNTLWV